MVMGICLRRLFEYESSVPFVLNSNFVVIPAVEA